MERSRRLLFRCSGVRGDILHLAGGLETNELKRNTEAPGELTRELDRNASRFPARPILLRQHRIAEVYGGPELARGCKLACSFRRCGLSGRAVD
jgi:hypothetical protein